MMRIVLGLSIRHFGLSDLTRKYMTRHSEFVRLTSSRFDIQPFNEMSCKGFTKKKKEQVEKTLRIQSIGFRVGANDHKQVETNND